MMYLNTDGQSGTSATEAANIAAMFANLGLGYVDANKRRKADAKLKQQQTDAELGLKEKALKQQADLKKLELVAKESGTKDKGTTTLLIVATSTVVLATFGILWYVRNK